MLRAKTVFVVGAGASLELGLPSGPDLLAGIASALSFRFERHYGYNPTQGDTRIFEALKHHVDKSSGWETRITPYLEAAKDLSKSASQARSIDSVIENMEDKLIEFVGKLGIAAAILEAEQKSAPFRSLIGSKDRSDLSAFVKTWYRQLTALLVDNTQFSQVSSIFDNAEFIVFNYDRCLEEYLLSSLLMAYPKLGRADAIEIMGRLRVHRPYGSLGSLPWQGDPKTQVEFGDTSTHCILKSANRIKTFSEQAATDVIDNIKAALAGADRIIFLGFGFHTPNIQLLSTDLRQGCEVYGTGYRLPPTEKLVIERDLGVAFGLNGMLAADGAAFSRNFSIELVDQTCQQICSEYWRTFTAGPPAFIDQSPVR